MKESKKEELEQKMINAFEVEQLEDRLEMSWLGGDVINGDTGYEY